jgi:hypothetical protein
MSRPWMWHNRMTHCEGQDESDGRKENFPLVAVVAPSPPWLMAR